MEGPVTWRRRRLPGAALALGLLAPAPAGGGEPPAEIASLRALGAVELRVSGFDEEARRAGFDSDRLRGELAQRLVPRGVPVVADASRLPGRPVLYARVDLARVEAGWAYLVTLLLYQDGALLRSRPVPAPIATWDASVVGFAHSGAYEVRENLGALAEAFAADWARAHGTGAPSGASRRE